jgi:hypothetical protein
MTAQPRTIDELADYVVALDLKPGQEVGVDPQIWSGLSFDRERFDMPYKALDARLGASWEQCTDMTAGREGWVLIRRRVFQKH